MHWFWDADKRKTPFQQGGHEKESISRIQTSSTSVLQNGLTCSAACLNASDLADLKQSFCFSGKADRTKAKSQQPSISEFWFAGLDWGMVICDWLFVCHTSNNYVRSAVVNITANLLPKAGFFLFCFVFYLVEISLSTLSNKKLQSRLNIEIEALASVACFTTIFCYTGYLECLNNQQQL